MNKLITSVTEVQRVKALLTDDPKNFVFDFAANKSNTGAGRILSVGANRGNELLTVDAAGGRTIMAKRDTFPALIGTGIAAAMGFLGPCGTFPSLQLWSECSRISGMNTAHTHPRGSEFVISWSIYASAEVRTMKLMILLSASGRKSAARALRQELKDRMRVTRCYLL